MPNDAADRRTEPNFATYACSGLDGRRRRRGNDYKELERQARVSLHGPRTLQRRNLYARTGQRDCRKCKFKLYRPHPACRHQLQVRWSGRREILIFAQPSLPSLPSIKAQGIARGFLLRRKSNEIRHSRSVSDAACGPKVGLRCLAIRCNMARNHHEETEIRWLPPNLASVKASFARKTMR